MKEELEIKLVKKYPELCVDYLGDQYKTCFAWGFECGDGWFNLIDEALGEIDSIAKSSGVSVKIAQIKSKFGGLRLYLDITPNNNKEIIDKIYAVISKAEKISEATSEISGKPASKHVINRYIYTVTDKESKALEQDLNPFNT